MRVVVISDGVANKRSVSAACDETIGIAGHRDAGIGTVSKLSADITKWEVRVGTAPVNTTARIWLGTSSRRHPDRDDQVQPFHACIIGHGQRIGRCPRKLLARILRTSLD